MDVYRGRAQTLATNADCVGRISARAADELIRANATEKVPLHRLDKIKEVAIEYLKECSETGLPPSVRGVAARLGLSRGALYDYKRHHPDGEFSAWLDDFSDLCAEIVMQAAVMGAYKEASAIFTAKARASWAEVAQVELTYSNKQRFGEGLTTEEIAEKYAAYFDEISEE